MSVVEDILGYTQHSNVKSLSDAELEMNKPENINNLIRFYYVDVDQSNLNIKFLALKQKEGNNWNVNILYNVLLSSPVVEYLHKIGCLNYRTKLTKEDKKEIAKLDIIQQSVIKTLISKYQNHINELDSRFRDVEELKMKLINIERKAQVILDCNSYKECCEMYKEELKKLLEDKDKDKGELK